MLTPLLVALSLIGPTALAEDVAAVGEGSARAEALEGIDDDGIWAWIERLDGEVLSEKALEALDQDAEERVFLDDMYPLDVPRDFYRDPRRVLTGDPYQLDKLDPDAFGLPLVFNEHVEYWLSALLGPGRGYFKRWLERKNRYEDLIYADLDAAGLPRDLIYLAMVESGFNAYAYSHASAGGLWQFIPSTARLYGLEVDFWLDERRDPEKATRAALTMLGDLEHRFGDWYLAFAGYNTGPARVGRAIARAETNGEPVDYWTLVEQDLLHRETKGYVPKIIAAMIIGHHPERYGFTDLELHDPLVYDAVYVEDGVDVEILAECAGLSAEDFGELNPALRRFAIPDGGVDLRVPAGTAEQFLDKLAEVPASQKRQLVMHKVRSGESLSVIASRYGVPMSAVQSANRLRNANELAVGQSLVIPVPGRDGVDVAAATASAPSKPPAVQTPKASAPTSHTVRPGDTLSEIAERYDIAVPDLMRANGLQTSSNIRVGQVLKLGRGAVAVSSAGEVVAPAEAAASKATAYTVRSGDSLSVIASRVSIPMASLVSWNDLKSASSIRVGQKLRLTAPASMATSSSQAASSTYVVRSGDTLSEIAEDHDVKMSALMAANGLKNASSLSVGQKLTIPTSTDGWVTHVVRAGESLGIIAKRYGVSVPELQGWNTLDHSTIYPGSALRIRPR